jgi:16S rRNA (uracil1498-N3)-methyltransferase
MRSIRVHHPGPLVQGTQLPFDERVALHLLRVLRLKAGAPVVVFDGLGKEHDATLVALRDGRLGLDVGRPRIALPRSPLAITLAQGVSRGERMDYALQKATELGVHAIAPLMCERSVVRLDAEQAARKVSHWNGVAIAAAEQSGRADVPLIASPVRLEDHLAAALQHPDDRLRLVLDPACSSGPSALPPQLRDVELLIGPEGGLSEAELDLARRAGYRSLRLGPRVLRTETAAAAAIAVLQAFHGDLG